MNIFLRFIFCFDIKSSFINFKTNINYVSYYVILTAWFDNQEEQIHEL